MSPNRKDINPESGLLNLPNPKLYERIMTKIPSPIQKTVIIIWD
jgi:hypothetical protein